MRFVGRLLRPADNFEGGQKPALPVGHLFVDRLTRSCQGAVKLV